jgi:hypothetical protein
MMISQARFFDRSRQIDLPAAFNIDFAENMYRNLLNSPALNSLEEFFPLFSQILPLAENLQSLMENPNLEDLIASIRPLARHVPMNRALLEAAVPVFSNNKNEDPEVVRLESLDQFERSMSLRSPVIERIHLQNFFDQAIERGDLQAAKNHNEMLLKTEREKVASGDYASAQAIVLDQIARDFLLQKLEQPGLSRREGEEEVIGFGALEDISGLENEPPD